MLKKICKGQLGILLPSILSLQVSNNPFSLLPNLNTTIDTSNIKIPSSTNPYLIWPQNNLLNAFNPFQALNTIGISTGNSTLMGISLLANNVSNALPAFLNWKNLSNTNKTTAVSNIAGNTLSTLDNMLFAKLHVNDSALTKGINTALDALANSAMMFSPTGTIIGGAMKASKFISDTLGVGTDQMTTTDLVLDSSIMKLTPIGLVNTFGAKRAKDFNINLETIENVGSDYGGSVATINNAYSKANKKYGLLSNGSRRNANRLIDKATNLQNRMTNISDNYLDLLANINDLAYTRYGNNLNGGYLQLYIKWAKYGTNLNRIRRRKHRNGGAINLKWQPIIVTDYSILLEANHSNDIAKHLQGGTLKKPSYQEWLKTVNPARLDSNYDLETAYNVIPFEELELWRNATDLELKDNKYHLQSVNNNPDENGNLWFLKLGKVEDNNEILGEFDWYNSKKPDAVEFRKHYHPAVFSLERNRYYYAPITKHQNGGNLNTNSEWQPIILLELVEVAKLGTLLKDSNIDLTKDVESTLPNIIPEGALHAHKHHMNNAKELTKKGIPVVDNNGELQAEIERNEIIFNLEVTKKLEELNSKYLESSSPKEKDDLAIKAGKLLINEILHNTIDKTGLIKECKKGGTL